MNDSAEAATTLERARRLHGAGRLEAAVEAYRAVLEEDPGNFDALCLMGMALVQLGRPEAAAGSIERAVTLRPDSADAHNALGNVMMALGRHDRALQCYEAALAREPDFADGHFNLGNARAALGRHAEAVTAYQWATALRPDWAEAHLRLGVARAAAGRLAEALGSFETALTLAPGLFPALYNRANTLKRMGRHEDAIAAYRVALARQPDAAEAHNNLATSLAALGRHEEAVESYRRAIALNPEAAEVHNNLATSLADLGRNEEALGALDAALSLRPDFALAHFNRGNVLRQRMGLPEEAVAHYRAALAADPNYPDAGINLAHALLLLGRFEEGWGAYDYRIAEDAFLRHLIAAEGFAMPRGSVERDIRGQRLLLQGEQGLGDQIIFASMVPDAAATAEHVTLVVDPRLVGLFQRSFPDCTVTSRHDNTGPLVPPVEADRRYFLGSLGKVLRNRIEDFPGTPFLVADPRRRAACRARLDGLGPGPKVGVMWRGGVGGPRESTRSLSLEELRPALVEGVHWISLSHLAQAGAEVARFGEATGVRIHHWPEIHASPEYDDTAALLVELDAVVSVTCTAAHCASALGVATHVLVPRDPEWRYGQEGESIPWYGAMNLYRQRETWPLEAVAKAVAAL